VFGVSYHDQIEGFGSSFKREIKRRCPTPVSLTVQAPTLSSEKNFVDIDPEAKDSFGIPKARIHFQWGDNEVQMFQHAKKISADVFHAAGGVLEYAADEPEMPGYSLHETHAAWAMTPRSLSPIALARRVTVPNLYVCDASVFLNCTDKTTTLSILTFTLRSSEYLVQQFRQGDHQVIPSLFSRLKPHCNQLVFGLNICAPQWIVIGVLAVAYLLLSRAACAQASPSSSKDGKWRLTWNDEFNPPTGPAWTRRNG